MAIIHATLNVSKRSVGLELAQRRDAGPTVTQHWDACGHYGSEHMVCKLVHQTQDAKWSPGGLRSNTLRLDHEDSIITSEREIFCSNLNTTNLQALARKGN